MSLETSMGDILNGVCLLLRRIPTRRRTSRKLRRAHADLDTIVAVYVLYNDSAYFICVVDR